MIPFFQAFFNKGYLLFCLCLIPFFPTSAVSGAMGDGARAHRPYVDGELLIRMKPSTMRSASHVADSFGVLPIKRFKYTGTYHVKLPDNLTVEEALRLYADDPDVLRAEPNYLRGTMSLEPPDDAFFDDFLWGLHNTGQQLFGRPGTIDADIDALEAWEMTSDCSSVVIAVIDSGMDFHHPDLKAGLWTNPDEDPDNGIDDDGNG